MEQDFNKQNGEMYQNCMFVLNFIHEQFYMTTIEMGFTKLE
jgi:hypothetical protein